MFRRVFNSPYYQKSTVTEAVVSSLTKSSFRSRDVSYLSTPRDPPRDNNES